MTKPNKDRSVVARVLNPISNRFSFLILFGWACVTFISPIALVAQQDPRDAIVVVSQSYGASENARTGFVIGTTADSAIVETWVTFDPIRNPDQLTDSSWSVVVNPGTPESMIVPAKIVGVRSGGGPTVVLLSANMASMPGQIEYENVNSSRTLAMGDKVELYDIRTVKIDNQWAVETVSGKAKISAASAQGSIELRPSRENASNGFVVRENKLLGIAQFNQWQPGTRSEPIKLKPLNLTTNLRQPLISEQYIVQKRIDHENVSIAMVVNLNDPFGSLESFSGDFHTPLPEKNNARLKSFRASRAMPAEAETKTVKFRKLPSDERDQFKPPIERDNFGKRLPSRPDWDFDERWVAEFSVPYETSREPRLLFLDYKLVLKPDTEPGVAPKTGAFNFTPDFDGPHRNTSLVPIEPPTPILEPVRLTGPGTRVEPSAIRKEIKYGASVLSPESILKDETTIQGFKVREIKKSALPTLSQVLANSAQTQLVMATENGVVRLVDVASLEPIAEIDLKMPIHGIGWTQNGILINGWAANRILLLNSKTLEVKQEIPVPERFVMRNQGKFHENTALIARADSGDAYVAAFDYLFPLDFADGQLSHSIKLSSTGRVSGQLTKDGKRLIVGNGQRLISIRNTDGALFLESHKEFRSIHPHGNGKDTVPIQLDESRNAVLVATSKSAFALNSRLVWLNFETFKIQEDVAKLREYRTPVMGARLDRDRSLWIRLRRNSKLEIRNLAGEPIRAIDLEDKVERKGNAILPLGKTQSVFVLDEKFAAVIEIPNDSLLQPMPLEFLSKGERRDLARKEEKEAEALALASKDPRDKVVEEFNGNAKARIRKLDFDNQRTPTKLAWAQDSSWVFLTQDFGKTLIKLDTNTGFIIKQVACKDLGLKKGRPINSMSLGKHGLLIGCAEEDKAALVDPNSLELKRLLDDFSAYDVATSMDSDFAFGNESQSPFCMVNLRTGKKIEVDHKSLGKDSKAAAIINGGKQLLVNSRSSLHRFKIVNNGLEHEESGKRFASGNRIFVSKDESLASILNAKKHSFGRSKLKGTVFMFDPKAIGGSPKAIKSGNSKTPRTFYYDNVNDRIFTSGNRKSELLKIANSKGEVLHSIPTPKGGKPSSSFFISPTEKQVLMFTSDGAYLIDLKID